MLRKTKLVLLTLALAITTICSGTFSATATSSYPSSAGMKGCSVPAAWYDSQSYAALPTIKADGFNTVRLVWTTSMTASRMDQYLTQCDLLGLRAIVELHDASGGQDTSSLTPCVNYWCQSDVRTVLWNHPNDWINIANEWGPANSTVWRDGYKNAVQTIRTAGYIGVIVIDSGNWGQDSNDILKYASAVLAQNTNKSVIFSIHMYGSWNSDANIDSFLNSCKSSTIPIMIGEFGYNYNNGNNNLSCAVDAPHLMSEAKSLGIGYLAWSWTGNDSSNSWLDMTSSSDWTTPTSWGSLVMNS